MQRQECACGHPEEAGTHGPSMCEIDDDEELTQSARGELRTGDAAEDEYQP